MLHNSLEEPLGRIFTLLSIYTYSLLIGPGTIDMCGLPSFFCFFFAMQKVLNHKQLFIENQAFSSSYDLAPPNPLRPLSSQQVFSPSQSSCLSPVELTNWKGRSHIKRRRDSQVLYKSFNSLCPDDCPVAGSLTWLRWFAAFARPRRTGKLPNHSHL